jgi:hypothetical protein
MVLVDQAVEVMGIKVIIIPSLRQEQLILDQVVVEAVKLMLLVQQEVVLLLLPTLIIKTPCLQ